MSAIRRAIYFAAVHSADHGIGEAALGELAEMERKIAELEKRIAGFIGPGNEEAWKDQMAPVVGKEPVVKKVKKRPE